jgi:hypothetical protein
MTRSRVTNTFFLVLLLAGSASAQTLTWEDTTSAFVNQADGFIIYHCVGAGCAPSSWYGNRRDYLLAGFHEEAHSRGLTMEQLGRGIRPFFQDGKLWRYSFERRGYVELEDEPRPRGGS